jgi:endonuclease/exonuclease/phosphatase family metal-dependent hydrolase
MERMKLLQLNILHGAHLDRVIDFAKKENVDILQLQEVTANGMSHGGLHVYPEKLGVGSGQVNPTFIGVDCFEELKKALSMDGLKINTYAFEDDPTATEGIATLFRPNFNLLDKNVVWLKDFTPIRRATDDNPRTEDELRDFGRAALITRFGKEGKVFTTVNTHMAWGPESNDEPHKLKQAEILHGAVSQIDTPFVLTGDFNVDPSTKTVGMFDDIGINWTRRSGIQNTLNPNLHPAKHLFPQGIAVDYIFTSPQIDVKSFRLIDEIDLSDHYGLLLEFTA